MPTEKNLPGIYLIRTIHILIGLFFIGCLGYLYVAAWTGEKNLWVYLALGAILLEGVVLLFNKGECPLAPIHHRMGDDRGFFDLFMPVSLVPYAIPFFVAVTTLAIILLFF